MTWLYNRTNGSILAPTLFHATKINAFGNQFSVTTASMVLFIIWRNRQSCPTGCGGNCPPTTQRYIENRNWIVEDQKQVTNERSLICPTKYRVHRFDLRMTADQFKLEQFLNSLEGEIVAIIPNVTWFPSATHVDFLLIVEKVV